MYSPFVRARAKPLLPTFDSEEVRILDLAQVSRDGLMPSTGAMEDVIYVVQGGSAMIEVSGNAPALLDPAHTLLVHSPGSTRIRHLSPGAKFTILVIARQRVAMSTCRSDCTRLEPRPLPLGVTALFRFFWLQQALSRATDVSGAITRSARDIHREALSSACLHSVPGDASLRTRASRRALADGARVRLAASVDMAHPLADVARGLHTSPFHLAHVFREEVGQSLHQYLVRLRLIAALGELSAGATDLSALALGLGFSSHSHFSVTFRRAFGMSPREARRCLTSVTLSTDSEFWLGTAAPIQTMCG